MVIIQREGHGRMNNGRTPLMDACEHGDIERVRALIKAGADVNARDTDGWTVLMRACRYGAGMNDAVEIVRALIEADADVHARDNDGGTALMLACENDGVVVRALIEAGADVNARDNYGGTALMDACRYGDGDVERVRALIEAGADVNARDTDGETALMYACENGDGDIVRALIEAGADVNARNNDGKTAMVCAQDDSIRRMLASGISSSHSLLRSATRENASTPLHAMDADLHVSDDESIEDDEEMWIPEADIDLDAEIGRGCFGSVHRGTWNGVEVAIKMISIPHPSGSMTSSSFDTSSLQALFEEHVKPEADFLRRLRHPFIVSCYGCCLRPPSIVMEMCSKGSLGHMLWKARAGVDAANQDLSNCLSWRRRLCMARQVATAVQFLHKRPRGGVLHRDLRSMNVVVTESWTAKVTDVGLSRFVDQVSSQSAGTLDNSNPRWMPPEVIHNAAYTHKGDVYGFGTILWELMTWKMPWEGMNNVQIIRALMSPPGLQVPGRSEWSCLPGPSPLHENTLEEFSALAARCLSMDPSLRPGFPEIVTLLKDMETREPWPASSDPTSSDPTEGRTGTPSCCICLEKDANHIMSGCGHLCVCAECVPVFSAQDSTACPMCRTPGLLQRVYF